MLANYTKMISFILLVFISKVSSITEEIGINLNRESEILLTCPTENKDDFVTWYKENSETKSLDELGFSEKIFFPALNSIQLKDFSKDDLGIYVCKHPLSGDTFKTFKLIETVLPEIPSESLPQWVMLPNSKNTVTNGRLHVFACRASGERVVVEAFRLNENGSVIEKLKQAGVALHNPSESDSGKYLCVANNSVATLKHEFSIFVIVHGGMSKWSAWNACDVSCGIGVQVRTRNCTNPKPANGGKSCSEESIQRRPCKTRPCSAPKLTKFGFDLTDEKYLKLDCFATGFPTPTIFWKLDGGNLPKEFGSLGTNLVIPKTNAQSGEYSCTVKNPAGYFTMYISVEV